MLSEKNLLKLFLQEALHSMQIQFFQYFKTTISIIPFLEWPAHKGNISHYLINLIHRYICCLLFIKIII